MEQMKSEEYFLVMNFSDRLSVCVTHNLSWDGCQGEDSRWLDLVFDGLDKEAVFFRALGVFDPAGSVGGQIPANEWNDGKRWKELWNRSQSSLQQATETLPMLRRFEAEYDDVIFSSDEVGKLRAECEAVRGKTEHPEAIVSLDKLIYACDEAANDVAGLFFASQ